ncbi:hypothetical protein BH11PLA1_BH11PLA1_19320 [soil metagenome]
MAKRIVSKSSSQTLSKSSPRPALAGLSARSGRAALSTRSTELGANARNRVPAGVRISDEKPGRTPPGRTRSPSDARIPDETPGGTRTPEGTRPPKGGGVRQPPRPSDPVRDPRVPGRTKPNPCFPVDAPHDCHCHDTPGGPTKTPKPPHKPARPSGCCEQLVELLRGVKGLNIPAPHKPKQSPERKVQSLCNALGISDAILPALALLWERHRAGEPGRNTFEKDVKNIFAGIAPKDQTALDFAMNELAKLRAGGKAECLFNDCLADAGKDSAIEKTWFAEVLVSEGLKFAAQIVFPNSGGVMGPGKARLWDNAVSRGPNGSGATIYQGPWPWLTAILPDMSSEEQYGNLQSYRPAPGAAHVWQPHEYAQTCSFTPDATGKMQATCARIHPAPPAPASPGGFGTFATYCEGGQNYTKGNDCLRIPAQRPGGSLKLRGFNFITPSVTVRFRHTADPSANFEVECVVWGDQKTPVMDGTGHFIVDERVYDGIDVPIAQNHPTIPGAPLPPGIYEITVAVKNVTNVVYDSATPPLLVSNGLLLRMEPDVNVKYLLWSERGRCNRETGGLGSDEIWWDAFVGHIVPTAIPVPSSGTSGMEIRDLDRRSFPRGPWDDMDDGEGAGAYKADIFGPASFELYGVVAVAMIGYEVDSESAARDQLQGFWNAWSEALQKIVGVALTGEGIATGWAGLAVKAGLITASTGLSAALAAFVIIAVVTLICTALWAAWAPADLIALDMFHLDALNAWDMTDPAKPLPPGAQRQFGDPDDDDNIVTTTEFPKPKLFSQGDAAATFVQETMYETPDDGEDASYVLEFRMSRT